MEWLGRKSDRTNEEGGQLGVGAKLEKGRVPSGMMEDFFRLKRG